MLCTQQEHNSDELGIEIIDRAADFGDLDPNLIDRARQSYYNHQLEPTGESHKALLLSLVEVYTHSALTDRGHRNEKENDSGGRLSIGCYQQGDQQGVAQLLEIPNRKKRVRDGSG